MSHPGDAFAFDIYSQAGRVVRDGAVLGPLKGSNGLTRIGAAGACSSGIGRAPGNPRESYSPVR